MISKPSKARERVTYGGGGHALIRVIVSTRSDIFKSQHELSIK